MSSFGLDALPHFEGAVDRFIILGLGEDIGDETEDWRTVLELD
jgi:hypothetical protein